MRDKFMKALVLFTIGVLSGVLIWGANMATEDTIALNVLNREKGFYKDLFELSSDTVIEFTETEVGDDFYEIEITLEDGTVVGYVYKGLDNNNYGKITVLVGIINGEIKNVLISDTTNTPNYFKKIEKNYLSPFSGQSTNDVTYDTKTGASYTYGSVSDVVAESATYYNTERGAE